MKINLIAWTPSPEIIIATAGKTCYSSDSPTDILEEMTEQEAARVIKHLMGSGHLSPLEHASFTFAAQGVSRSLLAQLTRHRIASFSVQSQRYVNSTSPDIVAPYAISHNPYAKRIFEDLMDEVVNAYNNIHHYLVSEYLREQYPSEISDEDERHAFWDSPKFFHLGLDTRMKLKKSGSVDEQSEYTEYRKKRSQAEKYANENARAVLPNATATNLVFTMNARELLHFFSLRCCNRAQDEIRTMANKMLVLCRQVAPNIFQKAGASCVYGTCPEGNMSCGHPQKEEKDNASENRDN